MIIDIKQDAGFWWRTSGIKDPESGIGFVIKSLIPCLSLRLLNNTIVPWPVSLALNQYEPDLF